MIAWLRKLFGRPQPLWHDFDAGGTRYRLKVPAQVSARGAELVAARIAADIDRSTVYKISRGKAWKHVTSKCEAPSSRT